MKKRAFARKAVKVMGIEGWNITPLVLVSFLVQRDIQPQSALQHPSRFQETNMYSLFNQAYRINTVGVHISL